VKEPLHIAIVGHVDHGKSTLIGRLLYDTGSLPDSLRKEIGRQPRESEFAFLVDHLEEERRGRITMDTAQIFFQAGRRRVVIIDTPGHKEFLKNTLTGCCQAEAAILLIDVSEGVREQTERHCRILSLLGLKNIIVAINKMDLAHWGEGSFQRASGQTRTLLNRLGMGPPLFTLPVSARLGDNIAVPSQRMPWCHGPSLLEALQGIKIVSPEKKELRLPVQGVFESHGERIVMGRIESGKLIAGRPLKLLPEAKSLRLKSICQFGKENPDRQGPGECVGFVVEENIRIRRGQVLVEEGGAWASTSVGGVVFWLGEREGREGDRFLFRCATQEVWAKITRIRKDESGLKDLSGSPAGDRSIGHGDSAEVDLTLEGPVVADLFSQCPPMGRFVLEQGKVPLAGGIIKRLGRGKA